MPGKQLTRHGLLASAVSAGASDSAVAFTVDKESVKRMLAQDDADDDLIGVDFDGYQIIRLLGQGGMAKVYLAHETLLDRKVALKILPLSHVFDATSVERFKREARTMAKLDHPNIVRVFTYGQNSEKNKRSLYIVMEYIPGGDLRRRIQRPMKIMEAASIVCDVATALDAIHQEGIIHRDVKPVNVLLDILPTGQVARAILADFGIAKVAASVHLTHTGASVGTPEYMSPEQCSGGTVDFRSDIYALGILLYELLCGHPPFMSHESVAVALAHIHAQVPRPTSINRHINEDIQHVILTALQKDPAKRFRSAHELARALAIAMLAPSGTQSGRLVVACKHCGSENPATLNFCAHCGEQSWRDPIRPSAKPVAPTITCRGCSMANPSAHHYCMRCGEQLPTRTCRNCGHPATSVERFCALCGVSLAES